MKLTHILAASAISLVTAAAFAGDWYVAGSLGQSKVKDTGKSDIDAALVSVGVTGLSSSLDDTDTAYKLQLGYKFTPNWAIEGGYVDLGQFEYNAAFTGPVAGSANAKIEATGWNIAGVGTLPINDQFSVFGKLGLIDAKVKGSVSATGGGATASGSASKTKAKANWGIGANYAFDKQWGIRAEWERFNKLGDEDTTGESNVDLLSLGVVLNF